MRSDDWIGPFVCITVAALVFLGGAVGYALGSDNATSVEYDKVEIDGCSTRNECTVEWHPNDDQWTIELNEEG